MPTTPEEKFEREDLPRIHAALQVARERKEACSIKIDISENGGVISVVLEAKRRFK